MAASTLACLVLFGAAPAGAQVNIEDLVGHEHEEEVDNRFAKTASLP